MGCDNDTNGIVSLLRGTRCSADGKRPAANRAPPRWTWGACWGRSQSP